MTTQCIDAVRCLVGNTASWGHGEIGELRVIIGRVSSEIILICAKSTDVNLSSIPVECPLCACTFASHKRG